VERLSEAAPSIDEELCQHHDARIAWIRRDLEVAARKATRCREGSRTYMTAVADIKRLKKALAEDLETIQFSGPKCNHCLK
jgi:hypothetical protein